MRWLRRGKRPAPPADVPVQDGVASADAHTRIFLSYAHEDDGHRSQVLRLCAVLRELGFTVVVDRDVEAAVTNWPLWQESEIDKADFVLVVASPRYRARAAGEGPVEEGRGVWAEARKLGNLIWADKGRDSLQRILPVVLPGGSARDLPWFFAPPAETYFPLEEITPNGLRALLRVLRREVRPVEAGRTLHRTITVDVTVMDGRVHTQLWHGTAPVGQHDGPVPMGIDHALSRLTGPPAQAAQDLLADGRRLAEALLAPAMLSWVGQMVDATGREGPLDVVLVSDGPGLLLPYELMALPDGRVLVTVPGVRMLRRLRGVEGVPSASPPGPLRILAAVAAPERTANVPLDVEREMQAIVDVVADLGTAEVTILEVASLAEISAALHEDSYHVLHLSAHGSSSEVELEDEDGNAVPATAEQLVRALQLGGTRVPLVVLSSCAGAAGGDAGLAATLLRSGADRVIAMQTSVSDEYATRLVSAVYRDLASSNPSVAQALARARAALYDPAAATGRPEYGVAALFAAAGDPPLVGSGPPVHLSRRVKPGAGREVRDLPIGYLIGRRRQVRDALTALRDRQRFRDKHGATRGVQLTGIGGIGKSAVAGRVVARLREETRRLEDGSQTPVWTVVVHEGRLSQQSLVERFAASVPAVADLLPKLDDSQKLPAMLDLLERTALLLVLDDFEQNLSDDGRSFLDDIDASLFHTLCGVAGRGRGRVLVTCRYPVPDEPALFRIEVPPLSRAELRRMFLRMPKLRDLSPADRQLVVATIGGHPRLIEFTDALLRGGTGLLDSVTQRLKDLAAREGVVLTSEASTLSEAARLAMVLGTRDILLDELLALLTDRQKEALLQAAVSRVPMTVAELGSALDPPGDAAADVRRLVDLALVSHVDGPPDSREIVVHTWVAEALAKHQGAGLATRHNRAFEMRLRRINQGRPDFDDLSECVRHLGEAGRLNELVPFTSQASNVTGQLGTATLWSLAGTFVDQFPRIHTVVLDGEATARSALGERDAALALGRKALDIDTALAAHDPGDQQLQRNLSVSYERLGDLAVAAGDVAGARALFEQGLEIALRLSQADPGNVGFARDLSVSYNKLGDLAVAAGDVAGARALFEQGLEIALRLSQADPGNVGFARDLSVSYERLGDLAVAAGDVAGARALFEQGLDIRLRLSQADPGNVGFARDLSVSYNKLGDLAVAAGDVAGARALFEQGLEIALRLSQADPGNVGFARDLSVSYERLGDLAVAAGDVAGARALFEQGLEIALRLSQADPGNVGFARDLSVSYERLGDLAVAAGDVAGARALFEQGLEIALRLSQADPGNVGFARDLSVSYERLGDLAVAAGDVAGARALFEQGLDIRLRLSQADPGNVGFARDLSVSYNKLGDLAVAAGDVAGARALFQQALDIVRRLTQIDPGTAVYAKDLAYYKQRLAELE